MMSKNSGFQFDLGVGEATCITSVKCIYLFLSILNVKKSQVCGQNPDTQVFLICADFIMFSEASIFYSSKNKANIIALL